MRSPLLIHRSRRAPPAGRRGRRHGWLTHGLGGLMVAVSFVGIVGLGLLYVRLDQGPISLGPLAEIVVDGLNRDGGRRYEIGDVVLALGRDGRSSGLRLRDVAVRGADGEVIARAPEIGVRFRAWDAIRGDLAPTRIRLEAVDATMRRDPDGALSLRFAESGAARARGASFFDLLGAADRDRGALRKLRRIEADDVSLTYDDRVTGRRFTVSGVDIAAWRIGDELLGSLRAELDIGAARPARLTVTGARFLGARQTSVTAEFSGVDAAALAGQIEELAWLAAVEARIGGVLSAEIGDDGHPGAFEGRLRVGQGQLVSGDGARTPIERAVLDIAYDPGDDRFAIREAQVQTGALALLADGVATLERGEGGAPSGAVLELALAGVSVDPPGVFAAPLEFPAGQVAARVRFDPLALEIGAANLTRGASRFDVSGGFRREDGRWRGGLDFSARDVPATDIADYWPATTAAHARLWTKLNIRAGTVERLTGALRVGDGPPGFALDFTHSGVEAHVVAGMAPITGASGTGHLDNQRFFIAVDKGETVIRDGVAVTLDGSSFHIPDITVKPAEGRAALKAHARIADILALLDQPPLGLMQKFAADMSGIEGDAVVDAELALPLIQGLTPGMVDFGAEARATGVRYPVPLGGLVATSPELALSAAPTGLTVSGPLAIGGFDGAYEWSERFGPADDLDGGPRTAMTLRTRLDAAVAERIGLEAVRFDSGHAPLTVTMTANPGRPLAFGIAADLGPARLAIPGLGLAKGEGEGSVRAEAVLRDGLAITGLQARAPGFAIDGDVALDPGFALRSAVLPRFEVGDGVSLAVALDQAPDGARSLDVTGDRLSLAWLGRLQGGGGRDAPTTAKVAVRRLILTEDIALAGVAGQVEIAGGATAAKVRGKVNGGAEASVAYQTAAAGGASVRIEAADAGAFLRDIGYFNNGYGGALALDAALGPGGVAEVDGALSIDGFVVRQAPALAKMLSVASLIGLFDALQSGGITFNTVRAPFRVRDGVISLDEATAIGPSIGLKMDGDYATGPDSIDMTGVLTPAYALNAGPLSKVPVLGEVLGGEGEGLFAFTFSVSGPIAAPEVSVNPLSVLTPGVLRNMFSGKAGPPGEVKDLREQAVDR